MHKWQYLWDTFSDLFQSNLAVFFLILPHKSHNERNLMDRMMKTVSKKQHSLKKTKFKSGETEVLAK